MPDSSITGQNLANRRGMLLGMTLAEIMLIVLFCLLLLLGKYFLELKEERKRAASLPAIASASWAQDLSTEELKRLENLVPAIRKLPPEDQSEAWSILTDDIEMMLRGEEENAEHEWRKKALEARQKIKPLEEQIRKLEKERDAERERSNRAEKRIPVLEEEIRKIKKIGSTPPCMHEPSSNPTKLRGPTIALGAIHIEDGRMTMVTKNHKIPSLKPVDYRGLPFYYEEAYQLLEAWPQNKPLNLEEFDRYAKEYLRIGDDESNGKMKCRFTMNYYIKDGVPYDIFVDVFEKYFYKQSKLDINELN